MRETNGLRIRGIEGQRADLRYWEKIGQGASLKLNVISGKSNGEFDFRQNGEFRANGGAQFGGNIHVSWGGRTATFHENGDVAGPIWGGALSTCLEKKINSVRKRTREVVVWSGTAGTGSTVTTSEDILGALIYLRCPGCDPKNNNYAQVMVPFTVGKATLDG